MLVIGAGRLSRYLCSIAVGLDYQVTVCDPREEYTDEWVASEESTDASLVLPEYCRPRSDARCTSVAGVC